MPILEKMTVKNILFIFLCLCKHPYTQTHKLSFMPNVEDAMDSNFITDNTKLPDKEAFLANFLGVQPDQITITARQFIFENSTAISKIRLLHYGTNGKYKKYTLTEDIPLDPGQDIKIVIHGWKAQGTNDWVKNITNSYHNLGVNQTLALDWSPIADENYLKSAGCVEHVGITLAEYIWRIFLKENATDLDHIHLIGHSLGAHVSGFFGKHIQKVSGGKKIYRITALDAAAPLFEFPIHQSSNKRIDESDAEFVDGFHTNAGFLGFLGAFANHDYYISYGGPIQPGCSNINIFKALECSHSRSHDVYNLTINSDNYLARHCDSSLFMFAKLCTDNILAVIGEQANSTDISGQFFIYVDKEGKAVYPWDQHGLVAEIINGVRSFVGNVVSFVGKIF